MQNDGFVAKKNKSNDYETDGFQLYTYLILIDLEFHKLWKGKRAIGTVSNDSIKVEKKAGSCWFTSIPTKMDYFICVNCFPIDYLQNPSSNDCLSLKRRWKN